MQKIFRKLGFILVVALVLAAAAQGVVSAQAPTTSGGSGEALLNLDNTVAVHGYDPVAYFTRNKAVRGHKSILERIGGATYYFASRSSRYTFLENAPKYQPQVGGFCATSMAMGRLEDIDPQQFVIFSEKLYLFKDAAAREMFLNDPQRMIREATQNYFKLASQRRTY